MLNDIIKEIYLILVRIISFFCSRKNVNNKVSFVIAFPQTDLGWISELKQKNIDVDVYYFMDKLVGLDDLLINDISCYKVSNNFTFIFKYIKEISSSSIIVIDSYLGFLANFNKNKKTEVIQIWHANGAIKKFGLDANQNINRTNSSKKRFKNVYENIDTYIVASDEMKYIFYKSYLASDKKFLKLGYYAVDKYFDVEYIKENTNIFCNKYQNLKNKKILLYAPTYRESEFSFVGINIRDLSLSISSDYHIFVKYHPHMKVPDYGDLSNVTVINNKDFNFDILPVVECLVTDYSSIIYDYSVLKRDKKIFIYANDFDEYNNHIGINEWFMNFYLNNKVDNVEDLCYKLESNSLFDENQFSSTWNKYNDGKAQKRIVEYISSKF